MRKILAALLMTVMLATSMLALSSCAEPVNGVDGKNGADGRDGATPYIGENGNWWLGDTDTGICASGLKGAKGDTGDDGPDGNDGEAGKNGKDGVNPIFRYNVKTERLEASYNNGKSWSEFPTYPFDDYVMGAGYNYPVSKIQKLEGCVDNISNRYRIVTGYYGGLVPLDDINFDTVTIKPSSTAQNLAYSFFNDELVVGEVPSFAEGYYEIIWTGSGDTVELSIPEDAKYMYIYYESEGWFYIPDSISFSNSQE